MVSPVIVTNSVAKLGNSLSSQQRGANLGLWSILLKLDGVVTLHQGVSLERLTETCPSHNFLVWFGVWVLGLRVQFQVLGV